MFKLNEIVVYPAYGLAKVKRIENKTVGGKSKQFYVLSVVSSGMTIMVPTDQTEQIGMRALVTKQKARQVAKYMTEETVKVNTDTWNKRYREFMEKLKTGDIDEIAYVALALKTLQKSKDLSFGERKMLDMAGQLLHSELTLVLTGEMGA